MRDAGLISGRVNFICNIQLFFMFDIRGLCGFTVWETFPRILLVVFFYLNYYTNLCFILQNCDIWS